MVNALEVTSLAHRYVGAAHKTFSDVSLSLRTGELLAILGASGSGKSTFLRCLAGLEDPAQGSIKIGNEFVVSNGHLQVPAERRGIGMVFQDYALFPSMTVRENILFGVTDEATHLEVLNRWLKLLELEGLDERYPASLSGGQQQRVALARALAPAPKLLLLDEPFANLDGNLREEVGHELRTLFSGGEIAVVLVTHDRSEAFALADRVAVFGSDSLEPGPASLKQIAAPQALFRQPADLEVAKLTGQVSVLKGTITKEGQVSCGGATFESSLQHAGEVNLVVRPDDLEFEPVECGLWLVTRIVYSGGQYFVWLSHENQSIRLHMSEELVPQMGSRGKLRQRRKLWALEAMGT